MFGKSCSDFGVYSMSTFIVEGVHGYLGVTGHEAICKVLSRVRVAVYLGVLRYWTKMIMIWLNEPKQRPVIQGMCASLFALRSQLARRQTTLNSSRDKM